MPKVNAIITACVMLSDQSSSLEIDEQGSAITENEVETSHTVTDVSASLKSEQLKLNQLRTFPKGRSTWL
jgi:hypothetical protein